MERLLMASERQVSGSRQASRWEMHTLPWGDLAWPGIWAGLPAGPFPAERDLSREECDMMCGCVGHVDP